MRKIRQVLRLFHEVKKTKRHIARIIGISRDTVADYLTRAAVAGLNWPLPPELDDAELEKLLYPQVSAAVPNKAGKPDWPKIHIEFKKPHAMNRPGFRGGRLV